MRDAALVLLGMHLGIAICRLITSIVERVR